MYLWSWSCRRTGSRSSRIHRASVGGIELAVHRREVARRRRSSSPRRRTTSARPLVVGAIGDHELELVVRRQALEVRPAVRAPLRCPGHFRSTTRDHGVGHRRWRRAAGLEQHLVPRSSSSRISGSTSPLQQRLAAGDLDQRHANAATRRPRPRGSGAIFPAAGRRRRCRTSGSADRSGEAHEDARAADMGRLALDGVVDLVDRQHRRYRKDMKVMKGIKDMKKADAGDHS